MSGTRTYSDYVCRSVNSSEKKGNCSGKAEVVGQGADQSTKCQTCLGGTRPCHQRHRSRSKVRFPPLLADDHLHTRATIPIEAQKEQGHPLCSLSGCGA